jgi:hypothetical protein
LKARHKKQNFEHEVDDNTLCKPDDVNYKSNCPPELQVKKKVSEHWPSKEWKKFALETEEMRLDLYLDPKGHCTVGEGLLVNYGDCFTAEDFEEYEGKVEFVENKKGDALYRVSPQYKKEFKNDPNRENILLAKYLFDLEVEFKAGNIKEADYRAKLAAEQKRRIQIKKDQMIKYLGDVILTQHEFDGIFDRGYNGGFEGTYWQETNRDGPLPQKPKQIRFDEVFATGDKKAAAFVLRNSSNVLAYSKPLNKGGNGHLNRRYQNFLMWLGDCTGYTKPPRPQN